MLCAQRCQVVQRGITSSLLLPGHEHDNSLVGQLSQPSVSSRPYVAQPAGTGPSPPSPIPAAPATLLTPPSLSDLPASSFVDAEPPLAAPPLVVLPAVDEPSPLAAPLGDDVVRPHAANASAQHTKNDARPG